MIQLYDARTFTFIRSTHVAFSETFFYAAWQLCVRKKNKLGRETGGGGAGHKVEYWKS
jgi:hypothetical protein